jgi:hypothetical protein
LFKAKEGENFNHRNTLSISRIELKLHFVQNVEPDAGIEQKGAFFKGLRPVSAILSITKPHNERAHHRQPPLEVYSIGVKDS